MSLTCTGSPFYIIHIDVFSSTTFLSLIILVCFCCCFLYFCCCYYIYFLLSSLPINFLLPPSTLHLHSSPSPHMLCKPCTHTYMVVTMHTQDKLDYLCLMHSTQHTHAFSLCVLSSLAVCCLELLTFPYVHCYV